MKGCGMEKLIHYIEKFGGRRHENWTRDEWNKVVAETQIDSKTLLSLGEAANFVGHKHDLSVATIKALYEQMEQAAGDGLTVRNQHTEIPYIPTTVHRHRLLFEALVCADELDSWLQSQRVPYRIQPANDAPAAKGEAGTGTPGSEEGKRPLQQQAWQENEILRVIQKLKYTATALPKEKRGVSGVKAAVRNDLRWIGTLFDKAWQRLRDQGRIKEA